MFANNETGVIHPISEIGEVCRRHEVLFHCDAAQAFGKVPIDVEEMGIDLLAITAHKLYGPKGIGALYVRRRNPPVRLAPQIHGGGQEQGNRPGTLNVSGIVGFGEAARVAREDMEEETARILGLRERLRTRLVEGVPHVRTNGSIEHRLPGTLNVSFAGVEAEGLLTGLEGVAVSAGAACNSASAEPSYVLRAMGVPNELAHTSLRITIGRFTTPEEVDFVVDRIRGVVERLRGGSQVAG
jgi:cysteine desulfurase